MLGSQTRQTPKAPNHRGKNIAAIMGFSSCRVVLCACALAVWGSTVDGAVSAKRVYTKVSSSSYYQVYSEGGTNPSKEKGYLKVGSVSFKYAANYTDLDAKYGGYHGYRRQNAKLGTLPSSRLAAQASCLETRDAKVVTGKTKVWIASSIQVDTTLQGIYHPATLEVDLFREVSWRTACTRPTELVLTHRCTLPASHPGILTAELLDGVFCTSLGSYTGFARSAAAQQATKTVLRFLVGATDMKASDAVKSAVDEVVADIGSTFSQHYGAVDIQQTTVLEHPPTPAPRGTFSDDDEGSKYVYLAYLVPLVCGVAFACIVLPVWQRAWAKKKEKKEQAEREARETAENEPAHVVTAVPVEDSPPVAKMPIMSHHEPTAPPVSCHVAGDTASASHNRCGKWIGGSDTDALLCHDCAWGSKEHDCCVCGKWRGSSQFQAKLCRDHAWGQTGRECCRCGKDRHGRDHPALLCSDCGWSSTLQNDCAYTA